MTEAFITASFRAVILSGGSVTVHMLIQLAFECKCAFASVAFELAILVSISMKFVQSRGKEKFSTVLALQFPVV